MLALINHVIRWIFKVCLFHWKADRLRFNNLQCWFCFSCFVDLKMSSLFWGVWGNYLHLLSFLHNDLRRMLTSALHAEFCDTSYVEYNASWKMCIVRVAQVEFNYFLYSFNARVIVIEAASASKFLSLAVGVRISCKRAATLTLPLWKFDHNHVQLHFTLWDLYESRVLFGSIVILYFGIVLDQLLPKGTRSIIR